MFIKEDQLAEYQSNGFLIMKDVFSRNEIRSIEKYTDVIQNLPETKGKWMHFYEYKKQNNQRFLCRTEFYLDFFQELKYLYKRLETISSDLLGDQAIIYKEKINYKLPGGDGFAPHQDSPAFESFTKGKHLTTLISVDSMTKDNGCLQVASGRHKEGIFRMTSSQTIHPDIDRTFEYSTIIANPGDVVFFSDLIPHKSDKNYSKFPRRIHYITYNLLRDGSYRNRYYEEKRRLFPPEIEREMGKDYSEGAKIFNIGNPIRI